MHLKREDCFLPLFFDGDEDEEDDREDVHQYLRLDEAHAERGIVGMNAEELARERKRRSERHGERREAHAETKRDIETGDEQEVEERDAEDDRGIGPPKRDRDPNEYGECEEYLEKRDAIACERGFRAPAHQERRCREKRRDHTGPPAAPAEHSGGNRHEVRGDRACGKPHRRHDDRGHYGNPDDREHILDPSEERIDFQEPQAGRPDDRLQGVSDGQYPERKGAGMGDRPDKKGREEYRGPEP